MVSKRQFIAYFFFVRWDCISLGIHLCITGPHVEIHVPFGFFRIGWTQTNGIKPMNSRDVDWRCFGLAERYLE